MHLKRVTILSEKFPVHNQYPFDQAIFHKTRDILFRSPVTFFVGENGSGKTTLLEALSIKCGIHIWGDFGRIRFQVNPFERELYRFISIEWKNGAVPGSFFSSELFRYFSQYLDEWATADPHMLKFFGGQSLMTQSHGQSLMSFFRVRYKRKGLYLMDEPETALSPRSQIELLRVLHEMGDAGHAQFVIATHSPILLACPGADIFSFDHIPLKIIQYEETAHYRIYRNFMNNRDTYISKNAKDNKN